MPSGLFDMRSRRLMTAAPTILTAAGVGLAVDVWGSGPPVLVLHGFTGSAAAMNPLTSRLEGFTVIAPDLVGHGRSESPSDPDRYTVPAMAEQALAAAAAVGHRRVHLLGYSMGGRTALAAACAAPDRVRSLTVIGATAGIADSEPRRRRAEADRARAEAIEADLVAFVDQWMSAPLLASQARLGPDHLRAARAQRLAGDPAGLALSLRMGGAGAMEPLHDRLRRCRAPAHIIAGADDAKFCALADELAALLPRASVTRIAGAGHAAHLEQPEATAAAVVAFLASLPSDPHPK